MRTSYLSTAWQDLKNSPAWFSKLLLLSLLSFIPVFGPLVCLGYLLGWARDIAWGVHAPLPARVFDNTDGKLYSRGFFALIIAIIFLLIPLAVLLACNLVIGGGLSSLLTWQEHSHSTLFLGSFSGLAGLIFFFAYIALDILGQIFCWVGWMRMSIYGRLSAGLQFNVIWTMLRHDTSNLLRIFGMQLALSLIAAALASTIFIALALGAVFILALIAGFGSTSGLAGIAIWTILAVCLGTLVVAYAVVFVVLLIESLTIRALGYWTYQFEVARWRGQDDPLPFQTTQYQARHP